MWALVSPLNDNIVIKIEEITYYVEAPLFWVECSNSFLPNLFYKNGEFIIQNAPVEPSGPTSSSGITEITGTADNIGVTGTADIIGITGTTNTSMYALIDPDDFKIYDISPDMYSHTSGAKWVEWLDFPENFNKNDMWQWHYSTKGVFVKTIISKEENKTKAKQLIADTDWSVLEDVGLTDKSKAEYLTYRVYIRNIIKNPIEGDISWPDKPVAEFK